MQAAGVTPDRESFSAAAEACAADTSGALGDRAIELLNLAREQGLKKPGARAVAASLAAIVGGGPWRRAVPAIEEMLEASGRRAWDDAMKFLADVQLAREEAGPGVQGGLPMQLPSASREEDGGSKKVELVAVTAEPGGGGNGRPPLNGYGSDHVVGASGGGGAVVDTGAVVAASDPVPAARKRAPLETRRVSETASNNSRGDAATPSKDGESRQRGRCGKTARGAVAAAATLKLGCVPALAQVVVAAAACVDKAL